MIHCGHRDQIPITLKNGSRTNICMDCDCEIPDKEISFQPDELASMIAFIRAKREYDKENPYKDRIEKKHGRRRQRHKPGTIVF